MPGSRILCLRSIPLAAALVIVCAGCAHSQPQTEADTFLSEHETGAVAAVSAMRAADMAASRLAQLPAASELAALAHDASGARQRIRLASEWSVAEGGEEEDVPRAEGELVEGSDEFVKAMASLLAYSRSRAPHTLAVYRAELGRGREKWNEGIGELWHLAGKAGAPTV